MYSIEHVRACTCIHLVFKVGQVFIHFFCEVFAMNVVVVVWVAVKYIILLPLYKAAIEWAMYM